MVWKEIHGARESGYLWGRGVNLEQGPKRN